jgi:hypothetical protein
MGVGLEFIPKRLRGHDDARHGSRLVFTTIALAAGAFDHPGTEGAMEEPPKLSVESRVLLEALAETHLLGKSDDDMAVALGW